MRQQAKKVSYFGHQFDSQTEATRYLWLRECEQDGLITGLEVHPEYTLIPRTVLKQTKHRKKKTIASVTYTPDFRYFYQGELIVEDVKGLKTSTGKPLITESARLKHRIFMALNPDCTFQLAAGSYLTEQIIMPDWVNEKPKEKKKKRSKA